MSDITAFNFGTSVVRTSVDSNGAVWFCAMDVAQCIQHSNGRKMLTMLNKEDVTLVYTLCSSDKNGQNLSYISESGLYRILFRSDLPKCEPFQKWLSNEVLPCIRKTGSYTMNQKPPSAIEAIALISQALTEHEQKLIQHATRLTTTESRVDVVENRQSNQDCFNQESRLTATQLTALDTAINAKFVELKKNRLAINCLKKQLKEKFLTYPLSSKTYKDISVKDFQAALSFVQKYRFGS
jgi:prophage antirepressor-like protein